MTLKLDTFIGEKKRFFTKLMNNRILNKEF